MSEAAEVYNRIHAILDDARKLSGPQLDRYLDESCGPDEELRASVLELLAAGSDDEASDLFADEQAGSLHRELAGLQEEALASWLPERIGAYTILRQLGQGGMGVVYEAEQRSPRRKVAIKLLHPMHATPESLRRFRREAQLLGRLQHPGIAQVIEASTYDLGSGSQPFFAMELVEGLPLTDYAEANALDVRARLALIAQLCDVLEFAHAKGVVHRDLKPANILVTTEASSGRDRAVDTRDASRARLKILDFGIARATDSDLTAATLQTGEGQLVGTISYMSPEQASGDPEAIDHRSDVYAVGVLAYELLAGHLPLRTQDKLLHEAVRVVLEDEPSALGTLDRALRGDVETIVAKALEKEKERRYPSAAELAQEIRRYLRDEPIVARPASAFYQLRKFSRRNKVLVGGVVATLVVAVVGAVIATSFAFDARTRARELGQVVEFQSAQLSGLDPQRMGERLRQAFLDESRAALERAGGAGADETGARVAPLEAQLTGINFANIALRTLDENILTRALEAAEEQFSDQPLVRARLLQSLATTMQGLGLLKAALAPNERALAIRRRELGDEHPDTLMSFFQLGCLQTRRGQHASAEPLLRHALAGRRRVLPGDHVDTQLAVQWLAYLLHLRGVKEESVALGRESTQMIVRMQGSDSAETFVQKGGELWQEDRIPEVEPYFREALAIYRRERGDEDPTTLVTIRNLADVLLALDRLPEAERLLRESLAGFRQVRGETHRLTLLSKIGLGEALMRQGKLSEAEPLLREALAQQREHLGDDHPETLGTSRALSELLAAKED